MKIPLYQVDAFADRAFQGNPAAICPLEKWLPEEFLQAIAEENNLSETAFYVGSEGQYELRWFTPTKEVDLCGHATLAAAHVLFDTSCRNRSNLIFQSRSGELHVTREEKVITLNFPAQPGEPCTPPEALIKGLGMKPKECFHATNYMAVFEDEQAILSMTPNFQRLCELDLQGVIITAPGTDTDFVSRFFAPKYGINEDPVTGSAHCTLAPYWSEKLSRPTMSARQLSKRTGHLHCRVDGDRVYISGHVIPYLEGLIQIDLNQPKPFKQCDSNS